MKIFDPYELFIFPFFDFHRINKVERKEIST